MINLHHIIDRYQIGFGITGLSTLFFFFTFQKSILAYIPSNKFKDEKFKLKWSVLFCAFGVFGQGIITMEEGAIDGVSGTNSTNSSSEEIGEGEIAWSPGRQSIIHQLLAAVFFMAAFFHGYTAINVYFN